MLNYFYTPGDQIVSLNEDCVEVEADGMVLEMDLMDLFESWLEYQFNEELLDEEYLEETKWRNKHHHRITAVKEFRDRGDVEGAKEALKKYDNFARGRLNGKKIGFVRLGREGDNEFWDEYHPVTKKESKSTVKAAKAIAKAERKTKGYEKAVAKAQNKDKKTWDNEYLKVVQGAAFNMRLDR